MKALYTLIKDILFLVQLFADIQEDLGLPVIVLEDNAAVVTLAMEETGQLKRSKHFAMITNFVKDCIGKGIIEIRKIAGSDNTADILTKKVRSGEFQRKAMKMLGHDEDEEPKDKETKEYAQGTMDTKEQVQGPMDTKEYTQGTKEEALRTKDNTHGTKETPKVPRKRH
jgi:hypothetical protein